MAQVELRGLGKVFTGGVEAVSAVDLVIGEGELLAIVGPSGSGKSTLLRLIAGLESPSAGSVWIGGRCADQLPPRDRDVAMVFQNPALYPHLRVFDNLAFGLRARGRPRDEVSERVTAVAKQLGLANLLRRWPNTLSGGQRQRAALGRAIVRGPSVFLLDEPFSSLDAPLRASLRSELLELHRALGTTMIHVTHDQAEAMAIGDRIAVMEHGRLVQVGSPREIYARPTHRFVGTFMGDPPMNILPCALEREAVNLRLQPLGMDRTAGWVFSDDTEWAAPLARRGPGAVELGIRPEQIVWLGLTPGPRVPGVLPATVEVRRLEPRGHEALATLALGPYTLGMRLPAHTPIRAGHQIMVGLEVEDAVWFDPATGAAI